MEGLYQSCRNWGKAECHSLIKNIKKIEKLLDSKKRTDRGGLTEIDRKEEIIKLDNICKSCKYRFFVIEEKICPVCHRKNFKEVRGFEFYNGEIKTREDAFLICLYCGTLSKNIKLF